MPRIHVVTEFSPEQIKQRIEFSTADNREPDLIGDAHREIVKLRDQGVREALIQLGWTEPGKTWTKTTDKLPPDETPVLVIIAGKRCVGELRWEHPSHEETFQSFQYWDDPYDDGQSWEWHDVTHWQYLPSLPEGIEEPVL